MGWVKVGVEVAASSIYLLASKGECRLPSPTKAPVHNPHHYHRYRSTSSGRARLLCRASGSVEHPPCLTRASRQNILKQSADGGAVLTSFTSDRCKGTRKRSWFKPARNPANTSTQPRTTTYQRIKTEERQPYQRRVGVPAKQAWAPRGAGAPAPQAATPVLCLFTFSDYNSIHYNS